MPAINVISVGVKIDQSKALQNNMSIKNIWANYLKALHDFWQITEKITIKWLYHVPFSLEVSKVSFFLNTGVTWTEVFVCLCFNRTKINYFKNIVYR